MKTAVTTLACAVMVGVTVTAYQARSSEVVSGAAATRVDNYLSRLVPHGFSGAVLIAKDGQVVLKRAYGLANRETKLPYAVDMVSCIGSVTKQFTGAAIVKLEEMGKLKTSDLISKYLPGVPDDKRDITIHQLLTHSAGLSGDLGGSDEEPITREALLKKVLDAPLAAKPGTSFEYSNEGYSLAAMIVERVSGQGYEAFLREHLFLPAGMKDTGYQIPAWPIERMPIGYRLDGAAWGRVYKNGWLPDGPGWYLRGNGGIQSSLDDLYRWHLALEKPGVFTEASLKKYLTGYMPSQGGGEMYAYGWGVQKTRRNGTLITHNGGNGFLFTDFRRYVDDKTVIIAMTNEPNIPATQIAGREIDSLFFGDGPAVVMPPVPVTVSKSDRDARAGVYSLSNGATLTVAATAAGISAVSSDPTLLGAIPGLAAPGGRFADLETKSMAILTESAKDNFKPIHEAFNDDRPFEVVQGNQRRFWAGWRSELGDFSKLELLGVAPFQGDPGVVVRVHFARGAKILQLMWGPRRLVGFRVVDAGAPVELIAESPLSWVLYSYRSPSLLRVTFAESNVTIVNGAITMTGVKK